MEFSDTSEERFSHDPDNDMRGGPRVGMRRERCAVCGMPVFLAEKLVISRTHYHRTCFRCARCNNQLTPGNYYETEEGQYCCETCPDEELEKSSSATSTICQDDITSVSENVKPRNEENNDGVYQRSLSDEEKTEGRAKLTSEILERLPISSWENVGRESTMSEINQQQTSRMRLSFLKTHLLEEKCPESTENSISITREYNDDDSMETSTRDSSSPGGYSTNRLDQKSPLIGQESNDQRVDAISMLETTNVDTWTDIETNLETYDFSDNKQRIHLNEVTHAKDSLEMENNIIISHDTANQEATHLNDYSQLHDKEISIRQDTKDKVGPDINVDEKNKDSRLKMSLVQRRLKIFESLKNEESRVDSSLGPCDDEDEKDIDEENEMAESSATIDSTVKDDRKLEEAIGISKSEREVPPVVPKRRATRGLKKSDVTVLNTSGIDLSEDEHYPKDLNPFGSDDDNNNNNNDDDDDEVCETLDKSRSSHVSTNPFGSSSENEEDDEQVLPPRPAVRNVVNKDREDSGADDTPVKRRLKAPKISFNPFGSDDDEDRESDDEGRSLNSSTPIPKPRTINSRQNPDSLLSPWKNDLKRGDIYASNTSLTSTGSTSTPGGTYRKKKPAPPPPIARETYSSSGESPSSTRRGSCAMAESTNSLRMTPRARKAKPAPPPPMSTSTLNLIENLTLAELAMNPSERISEGLNDETWNEPKNGKDEANRNKQSVGFSCDDTSPCDPYTDKSIHGKWKRKKGPAPARPIPHRRKIKVMSLKDVKVELDEIEMQQQGLEKQGVRLEQLIRDKAETGNSTEETSLGMDVEELVLELFVLVNEKNELFRRQAELMLLRRQQRLEEEHADIEYQIRCLLCQPEASKTDFDKQREETLIQRLVEIVERRNEIVECLEMDRRREVEEDRSINTQMGIYAAKNKGDFAKELEDEDKNRLKKSKKSKLKDKAKEKILRKSHKKDADKDVDETEVKLKRQNKKKWF